MDRDALPQPTLFCDYGCPFAHRVRALLDHLAVTHELAVAPTHGHPQGLERWSPSGRIPFLVQGEIGIAESRVMLECLADAYAWDAAYPARLAERIHARQAIASVQGTLDAAFVRAPPPPPARLAELLDHLAAMPASAWAGPSILTFYAGPMWLALVTHRGGSEVELRIRERPTLAERLDAAATLESVTTTAWSRLPRQDESR